MQDVMRAAVASHQAGRLGEAAQFYEQILAQDQTNAEALHLLGVLHHQQGGHARAVELIGRAIALRPNAAAFHSNLAECYRVLGQFERAVGCCRAALPSDLTIPRRAAIWAGAPGLWGARTRPPSSFARRSALQPDFAVAQNNLGNVLRDMGKSDEALEEFRRAIEIDPTYPAAQTNLGQMLLDLGQAEEALPHCKEAVRLPTRPGGLAP